MVIIVSSSNPDKVQAVKNCFPDETVVSHPADSGYGENPIDEQVIVGAQNRALRSSTSHPGSTVVGFETGFITRKFIEADAPSGVLETIPPAKMYVTTCCCVYTKGKELKEGKADLYPIPEEWGLDETLEAWDRARTNSFLDAISASRGQAPQDIISLITFGKETRYTTFESSLKDALDQN